MEVNLKIVIENQIIFYSKLLVIAVYLWYRVNILSDDIFFYPKITICHLVTFTLTINS